MRRESMDPITTVLIAGATIVLKDAASLAVKDAYNGLKQLLAGKVLSISALERAPTNDKLQQAVAEEVQLAKAAAEPRVLAQARELAEAIAQQPLDRMLEAGIDISQIHAAGEVLVKNLTAVGSVAVRDVDAQGGSVRIEGISAGRQETRTDRC
jgi:hypothetical protein